MVIISVVLATATGKTLDKCNTINALKFKLYFTGPALPGPQVPIYWCFNL